MMFLLCFPFRSDVINLQEEVKTLHKDIFPEFNKHLERMSDLTNECETGLRSAICVLRGAVITAGIAMVLSVLSFILDDEDVSEMFAGAGIAVAVVSVLCVAFGIFKKTQQEKKLKRNIEKERKGYQDKTGLIIDILEKICHSTEETLRDLSLSEHKARVLGEHFSSCFGKTQFFQEQDSKVGDMSKIGLLSGKLSEMMSKVSSVPEILREILEEDKRKKDKPAKLTHQQRHTMEIKQKAETFIHDMQKAILQFKKSAKETNRIIDRL